MKKFWPNLINLLSFKNNLLFFGLVLLCLLVSFRYRDRVYWAYPPIAETFDEFAAGWLGLSLFKTGIPTSWSFIPDYAKGIPEGARLYFVDTTITVDGATPTRQNFTSFPKPIMHVQEFDFDGYRSQFNMVMPYLEQPPLGGLIISLPLIASGKNDFSQVRLFDLRKPFPLIGAVSTLLVILLASLWYGRAVALASGFIYATVPTVVLGSRLALPENILVPLILAQVLFLELYRKDKKRVFLFSSYLLTFLAPLIKPFGLSLSLLGALYSALRDKDLKRAALFIILGVASFLTYVAYALSYDKNTFLWVLSYQGQRFFVGPHIFLYKIIIPRITKLFLDGWIFLGWAALFILAFREKIKLHLGLLIAVFSYLFVVLFFGGEDFGWYRFPLYPFLIIAAGYLVVDVVRNFRPFAALLILSTGIASSFAWGIGIYDWSPYLLLFRIFMVSAVFLLTLPLFLKEKKLVRVGQAVLLGLFIFSLFLNTRVINNISEIWPLLGDESSLIIGR